MVEYTTIKDTNGENFEILEWIPEMAKEYGWTSGVLDKDMARAIKKAREVPDDPWLLDSLAKSRFSYEAMRFCQGERSAERIHKDGVYKGENIIAIRKA